MELRSRQRYTEPYEHGMERMLVPFVYQPRCAAMPQQQASVGGPALGYSKTHRTAIAQLRLIFVRRMEWLNGRDADDL